MELVHNKASGKAFIVLGDDEGNDLVLITPEGKIKRLERCLFDRALSIPERQPLSALTKLQLSKYHEVMDG